MDKILKFFFYAFAFFQFYNKAFSCNYKLLELTADTFEQRIVSGISTSQELIRSNLNFLNESFFDEQDINMIEKYTQEKNFNNLYNQTVAGFSDSLFKEFTDCCSKIFKENEGFDPLIQAAAYILVQKVFTKLEFHKREMERFYGHNTSLSLSNPVKHLP